MPSTVRNRVTVEDLKDALDRSDNGIQLEQCFRFLNISYTNFMVARGNIDELIFKRLASIGCIPQPREMVSTRCGFNLYDDEDKVLNGLIREHYVSVHNQCDKDNGMEQFFKVYKANCGGKLETEQGTTEFDYFRTGVYFYRKFDCQRVTNKFDKSILHLHGVHGIKWDGFGDMNPLWRILKINIKEEQAGWSMMMNRNNIYMTNEDGQLDMSDEPTEGV
jgi:hypothetical protein